PCPARSALSTAAGLGHRRARPDPAGGSHPRRDRGWSGLRVQRLSGDHDRLDGLAIVYQQFENYVVQPRIQSRAAHLDSFVVIVAALFGGTLFGIVGALLAIPSAAAIQIAVREYLVYRREMGTTATASSDA
ncbi:MAG: AI-2E family transporter, partial [Actinobacteria bacterium]|nr:AI-2E family transporter [Actinomycetota bacterium]